MRYPVLALLVLACVFLGCSKEDPDARASRLTAELIKEASEFDALGALEKKHPDKKKELRNGEQYLRSELISEDDYEMLIIAIGALNILSDPRLAKKYLGDGQSKEQTESSRIEFEKNLDMLAVKLMEADELSKMRESVANLEERAQKMLLQKQKSKYGLD